MSRPCPGVPTRTVSGSCRKRRAPVIAPERTQCAVAMPQVDTIGRPRRCQVWRRPLLLSKALSDRGARASGAVPDVVAVAHERTLAGRRLIVHASRGGYNRGTSRRGTEVRLPERASRCTSPVRRTCPPAAPLKGVVVQNESCQAPDLRFGHPWSKPSHLLRDEHPYPCYLRGIVEVLYSEVRGRELRLGNSV